MTYNYAIHMTIYDECHEGNKPNMIRICDTSGDRHYCQECWPNYRDYYEGGRKAWKRVGNYYVPND